MTSFDEAGISLRVSLCWPAHVVSGRQPTAADDRLAQAHADDEWFIRIDPPAAP